MAQLKRLKLDVLKPHQPNVVELARAIAARGSGYRVTIKVEEVDEKTESVILIIEGEEIDFDMVSATILETGGSLHSIDEVEVLADTESPRR